MKEGDRVYIVDLYFRVRKACLVGGMGIREASRVFGLHRDTVPKTLSNPVPPGYRKQRTKARFVAFDNFRMPTYSPCYLRRG